jgi:hypothetical protein|tara:strand:+ start:910 stop:1692 length:783 start_codon:yes stop_codon:yes gene_type:complete
MGRSLHKKYFGDFSNLGSQFAVTTYIKGDNRRTSGNIVRQKSTRLFEIESNGQKGFCQLVPREPNEGEMSIVMTLDSITEGSGATFRVVMGVDQVSINNAGSGYNIDDELTLVDTGGVKILDAVFQVLDVGSSNEIVTLKVKSGQQGQYTSFPTVTTGASTTTTSNGTNATVDVTWKVVDLQTLTPGENYTECKVTFAQGSAACNPRIINGKVSNVVITNTGTGYTAFPGLIIEASKGTEYVRQFMDGEVILENGNRQFF